MNIVFAVIAGGSLIASIFAAVAAFRSAKAAETSAHLATRTLERAALREIVRAAYDVIAEAARIRGLAEELRLEYRTLFTFAGQSRGGGLQLYLDNLEKKLTETLALSQEAESVLADSQLLQKASEQDVTHMLSKLDGSLAKLRPIREALERERIDIGEQNKAYRDKLIGNKP